MNRRMALAELSLAALSIGGFLAIGASGAPPPPAPPPSPTAALIDQIAQAHGLTPDQRAAVTAIFAASPQMGQGNPAVTVHPMSVEACQARQAAAGVSFDRADFAQICGGPNMAPLYDPAHERPDDATACIDQLEFPDIPCAYPVVWARASEAADLCEAMGKRICDAHEWEGACAGALEAPDYDFDLLRGRSSASAVSRMREAHNAEYLSGASKTWSYGSAYREGVCGTGSAKTARCNGGDWSGCGSNTYPAGAFPDCHSALGVYDLNGNAAEHMNLPLSADALSSAGTGRLGVTEMKGSWFVFDAYRAHEDWCRWRAPFWHGTALQDPASHRNYHLGFRCCKSVVSE